MTTNVEQHVVERIAAAPVMARPYPHFYVENIFPDDFYAALRDNLPADEAYLPLGETGRVTKGAYMERFVLAMNKRGIAGLPEHGRPFWRDFTSWFMDGPMLTALCSKFVGAAKSRFGENCEKIALSPEILMVRDRTKYAIGPHTDSPQRFLSALFYCPKDNSMEHLGTSIYEPLDRSFRCWGGPHYGFDKFANVGTMPFRRNSLFCFVKTDNSFHGVEPIADEAIERDLILYNLRVVDLVKAAAA